jgi:hypothetical protein
MKLDLNMKKQAGLSLSEVLISLFLASIIMSILIGSYVTSKRQYVSAQKILETNFDLQWINDLLSNSIRRAGFTPCLGINQLTTFDSRNGSPSLSALLVSPHSIQVNRMSELFAQISTIPNSTQILVSEGKLFNKNRPVLIADCEHAEVNRILHMALLENGALITLTKPLKYSYSAVAYLGEWQEEQWFTKENSAGIDALHYKCAHTEELTSQIHSIQIKTQLLHGKQWVRLNMGLGEKKSHQFAVAIRSS